MPQNEDIYLFLRTDEQLGLGVGFVNDYREGAGVTKKATARVPARHPLFPRLYYDYGGRLRGVHSRGGSGCGEGRGPLRSPFPG
jgi:hypothetical protein